MVLDDWLETKTLLFLVSCIGKIKTAVVIRILVSEVKDNDKVEIKVGVMDNDKVEVKFGLKDNDKVNIEVGVAANQFLWGCLKCIWKLRTGHLLKDVSYW